MSHQTLPLIFAGKDDRNRWRDRQQGIACRWLRGMANIHLPMCCPVHPRAPLCSRRARRAAAIFDLQGDAGNPSSAESSGRPTVERGPNKKTARSAAICPVGEFARSPPRLGIADCTVKTMFRPPAGETVPTARPISSNCRPCFSPRWWRLTRTRRGTWSRSPPGQQPVRGGGLAPVIAPFARGGVVHHCVPGTTKSKMRGTQIEQAFPIWACSIAPALRAPLIAREAD